MLGLPTPSAASAFSRTPEIPDDAEALVQSLVDAVNLERESVGLAPLTTSPALSSDAEAYADRLIARDFFAHTDPLSGATLAARAKKSGYLFFKVGENLAAGQQDVESVMADWMDSATHRSNILDPDFTEIGIAVRDGGRFGRYWVQEFGRPLGQ